MLNLIYPQIHRHTDEQDSRDEAKSQQHDWLAGSRILTSLPVNRIGSPLKNDQGKSRLYNSLRNEVGCFLTAKKGGVVVVVVVFVVVCMLLLFNINLYWRLADTCCWHDNCNISLVSLV